MGEVFVGELVFRQRAFALMNGEVFIGNWPHPNVSILWKERCKLCAGQ